MKNIKWLGVVVLSFTLLLANSFTSMAQSNADKQKMAEEFSDKGDAAFAKGNYREAIEHYTVAIALNPDDIRAYQERGNANFKLKDYKAAIADYDKSIQMCSADKAKYSSDTTAFERRLRGICYDVYNNRGIAKGELGDKAGACRDFRAGCKLMVGIACKNFEAICNTEVSSSTKNKTPLADKAQNNSIINLVETSWDAGYVIIPTHHTDGSVTTLRRLYDFDKQGKVKSTVIKNKSGGGEHKYVYDYVYNPATNRDESRLVSKYVLTMPEFTSEILNGTYEINGKSIYLDFPDHTIRATIYSGSIKGILTYKGTNEKEEWKIEPLP